MFSACTPTKILTKSERFIDKGLITKRHVNSSCLLSFTSWRVPEIVADYIPSFHFASRTSATRLSGVFRLLQYNHVDDVGLQYER